MISGMDNLKKQLAEMGLTVNEIQVYLNLLEKGSAKPAFIARDTGIRRPNVYTVLERLSEYGLIEELSGFKSKVYGTSEINSAISSFLRREKEKFDKKSEIANGIISTLKEIASQNTILPSAMIYKDGARSISALNEIVLNANEECLALCHPPYFGSLFYSDDQQEIMQDEERNGYYIEEKDETCLACYKIFQLIDLPLQLLKRMIPANLALGFKIRVAKEVPAKLIIIDRKYVASGLIAPSSKEPTHETVIFYNPGIAEMLAESFFSLYEKCTEVTSLEGIEEIYETTVQ